MHDLPYTGHRLHVQVQVHVQVHVLEEKRRGYNKGYNCTPREGGGVPLKLSVTLYIIGSTQYTLVY